MPLARQPRNWPLIYLGVALTTLATLVFELALARVLSVILQPYFAFLTIIIALFGLAGGGLFSHVFPGRSPRLLRRLGLMALLASFAVVGATALLLLGSGRADGRVPAEVVAAATVPFFLAGAAVATSVADGLSRVNRIGLAIGLGGGAGCLLLVLLLAYLGGPNTVIGAAVLYAASAAVWFTAAGSLRGRVLAVAVALSWVTFIAWNVRSRAVEVGWAKGAGLEEPVFVRWNSFSRVSVQAGPAGRLTLAVDAEETGPIRRDVPELVPEAERHALLYQGRGIPFLLRPNARTLILNPGGGEELLRALLGASRSVTAVETNPLIAAAVARERPAQALDSRREVRSLVGDPRSLLRREDELYDIIRILPGSARAALPWGLSTLMSDSRLFTVEAFRQYLDRLSDVGLLVVSSSGSDPRPETDRLIGTLRAALRQAGEMEPDRHLALFREPLAGSGGGFTETLIATRRPFLANDLDRCRSLVEASGVEFLFPARSSGNGCCEDGRFAPPSDNQPRLDGDLRESANGDGPASGPSLSRRLWRLAGWGATAVALILALPLLVVRQPASCRRDALGLLSYFVFTGAGWVLAQAGLIRSFLHCLGNPTHALAAGVAAVLVAAGLGSYYSGRVAGGSQRSLMGALALAALLLATLAVVFPRLVVIGGGWPQPLKIAVTAILVTPAGFMLGMPLVAGLARLAAPVALSARWAWSLHSAAGALGSITAVLAAVHFGYRETMLFGGLMHLAALPAIAFSPRQEPGRGVGLV